MKKYIIASIISIFPVFILGLCLPTAIVMDSKKGAFNEVFFWWCAVVLAIGIAILLTTMLMLVRYVNTIDRLDEAESIAFEKKAELEKLIFYYNKIILEKK